MWSLTIRSPFAPPADYQLKPGKNTVGRLAENDVVIADQQASRFHAEIDYDPAAATVTVRDLESANGTFVNRERLQAPRVLQLEDQVRIVQYTLSLAPPPAALVTDNIPKTRQLTRDFVLEALDQHAVLLYEAASRLNTIIELEPALHEVSLLMKTAMGADKCEVILAEQFGELADLGFSTSFARQAIEQKSLVLIPFLPPADNTTPNQSAFLLRIRSVLCVPVLIGEEVVALIYVYKTDPTARPFDQRDAQLAVAISHQAALSIQRAHLLEKARHLEQLATLDGLTGLHNRRHYFELAEREFQRAKRFSRPLAMFMLDLDHFKEVNDTYGHAVGDEVLRAAAERYRANLRDIDLLGRYGGEEFAVMLVENDTLLARHVAERLRRSLADTPITTSAGPLIITTSVGGASLTKDCPDLVTFLKWADEALYKAKHNGRNRVEVR